MSDINEDRRWMSRALALAARGGRAVQPNPLVGALLVKDGRLIGEGWHRAVGSPHAEREALRVEHQVRRVSRYRFDTCRQPNHATAIAPSPRRF